MKVSKGWLTLVVLLVLLIFSLITLFFWDFVRDDIAVPVYNLLWISLQIVQSVPQQVFLGVLVLLCSVVALATLVGLSSPEPAEEPDQKFVPLDTRYAYWRRHCANFRNSSFSREQFAIEGRRLILLVLAYGEGKSVNDVETLVMSDELAVPPVVKDLIAKKGLLDLDPGPQPARTLLVILDGLLHPSAYASGAPVAPQITEIINFIERYLEITNAGTKA